MGPEAPVAIDQWVARSRGVTNSADVLHPPGIGFGQFSAVNGDQIILFNSIGQILQHCSRPLAVVTASENLGNEEVPEDRVDETLH